MQRIITLTLLLASLISNARTINEDEASRIAGEFLNSQGLKKSLSAVYLKNSPQSRSSAKDCPVHIFNLSEGGFIIIAGDDRAKPVLAYSHDNGLNPEKMPQPCIEWLNQYAAEIESLGADAIDTQDDSQIYPSTTIEPLIKTLWNQGSPFNNNCPTDATTGKKCLTGCVATATAQIMNYHRYPSSATGTITYEDKAQKTIRSLDLATCGDIDWANMPVPIPFSNKQNEAVANLMMMTGHALKMQYSSETSIAIHRDAAAVLSENFGYDPNIHRYERNYVTEKDWVKIVVDELSAGRPILYDGRSNESGGHTFVCDGYDGNGMFHFNWGWGGMADGYYALSALTPTSNSGTQIYTWNQAIECRIMPPGSSDSTPQTDYLLGIDRLNIFTPSTRTTPYDPEITYEGGKGESGFIFYCSNFGHKVFDGEISATITKDGEITAIANAYGEITAGSYTPKTFYMPESLADGSYTVGFHYRLPGDEQWHPILAKNGTPHEATLKVEGSNITYGKGAVSSITGITTNAAIEIAVTKGNITACSASGIALATLSDISGRNIKSVRNCGEAAIIDLSGMTPGIYILRVTSNDNNCIAKKIIL